MFSDDTPAKSGTVRLFQTRIRPFSKYCSLVSVGQRLQKRFS